MDHNVMSRKRRNDAVDAGPSQQEAKVEQEEMVEQEEKVEQEAEVEQGRQRSRDALRRKYGTKIRTARDNTEFLRIQRVEDAPPASPLSSREDGAIGRSFTVANIDGSGTLYLKPSRLAPPTFTFPPATPPTFTFPPATPPDISDGTHSLHTQWPDDRYSEMSGTYTPRPPPRPHLPTTTKAEASYPPSSLAHRQRRARSRSFSTISDHERLRSHQFDSADFQVLIDDIHGNRRRKSSDDLDRGLLDLRIPHYRLGTPRFSDRGTAYLHNSMYTQQSATDDMRSSVFSRAEYDRLFPVPPGIARQTMTGSFLSRASSTSPHLAPSPRAQPRTPSRTTPSPLRRTLDAENISPNIYDKITASPDDPAFVRYAPVTNKITAATPARLIMQITSPNFLDYELLADFFLTYRSFLSAADLARYLISRLQWAFCSSSDDGKIVRVRTFVALRHWILNYFADDFVLDDALRQEFCNMVNELAGTLRRRADGGGGDLNIVGELKKCWGRTCALFWPLPDTSGPRISEGSIVPGGEMNFSQDLEASRDRSGPSAFVDLLRSHPPQASLLGKPQQTAGPQGLGSTFQDIPLQDHAVHYISASRKSSIPVSPMSEQSIQVLSCSIPFRKFASPVSAGQDKHADVHRRSSSGKNPPLSGRPTRRHKRSGSFSDALRDERAPLPSSKIDSIDLKTLSAHFFTGGIIRGLLIEPSSPSVKLLISISPGFDLHPSQDADNSYFQDHAIHNPNVRRIFGNVRRILSSRQGHADSPSSRSQRLANRSVYSQASNQNAPTSNPTQESGWEKGKGPARTDLLAAKIEESYKEAMRENKQPADEDGQGVIDTGTGAKPTHTGSIDHGLSLTVPPHFNRLDSHVTTGSRSIVIVDDTGFAGKSPVIGGTLSGGTISASSLKPQPLFRNPSAIFRDIARHESYPNGIVLDPGDIAPAQAEPGASRDSDAPQHLSVPETWRVPPVSSTEAEMLNARPTPARKSSSVQPPTMDMQPPSVPHQLRRRPGGDLKAVDHVHDLEPTPRPNSDDTFSSMSRSAATSATYSGALVSPLKTRRAASSRLAPLEQAEANACRRNKDSVRLLDTHSSQPNLRPSFEAEVSKLAKMPDDPEDGGIEDALLKLEGRASSTFSGRAMRLSDFAPLERQPPSQGQRAFERQDTSPFDFDKDPRSPQTETQGASIYHLSSVAAAESSRVDSDAFDTAGELTMMPHSEPHSPAPVLKSRAEAVQFPINGHTSSNSSQRSAAFVIKTESMERIVKRDISKPGTPNTGQGSFLLDDNESLSESGISTEIVDSKEDIPGVRSFFFDTMDDEPALLQPFRPPLTPPSTVAAPTDGSPERVLERKMPGPDNVRLLKGAQSAPKLLSPGVANATQPLGYDFQPSFPSGTLRQVHTQPEPTSYPTLIPQPAANTHAPFILAYDSDLLAQQLTIIEKDALEEIDWKDLINLRWQHSAKPVRNWATYLQGEDAAEEETRGVDIVIARFNLVVKWAVSEVVLTHDLHERARVLAKLIHVAAHALRYRNYATMYQLAVALLSSDLSRLRRTWALVAAPDKATLAQLEQLVQPLRNFHALRQEMEGADIEHGCIPFLGLYTHDLIYNSQKPAFLDGVAGGEPQVNFERCQMGAGIVKGLLRLLEASGRYRFRPRAEVLGRCLWLAALEDGEILARSRGVET